MSGQDRRQFLGRLGSGVAASLVGLTVGSELDLLGILAASGANGPDRLDFGRLERLVSLMQETSADGLLPELKEELDRGTELRTLVAAAALANARTFGGQDYIGYHCFMAIVPSLAMSAWLPGDRAALPVFKVLHRNTSRIQAVGGRGEEVLRPVQAAGTSDGEARSRLLTAGRSGEFQSAEESFVLLANRGPENAFASMQPLVRDNIDVHQVVLAYRSWDMIGLAGEENAIVLLRAALRQCIDREAGRQRRGREAPSIRQLLPELIDAHGLDRAISGTQRLTGPEMEELAQLIFASSRDDAAAYMATRLAAGVARDDIGEALSIAAVRLLLHDPGRSRGEKGKPAGSVHGASVGLHAADSANAWRGIAAATEEPNANACLVTAAWHAAGQSGRMDRAQPHHAAARESASGVPAEDLLAGIGEAIRGGDQQRSCALAERYGEMNRDPQALISVLIEPAIRYDGALHHEKYFHTATEEFARTRPEFRWAHLIALTRVMASGYGFESEGLELSRQVLGV